MTADEILLALTRTSDRVPEEALRVADTQRTELTPTFLAALAEAVATPDRLKTDPDYQLPFYAFYLLAAWREPRVFPLLLGFLRLPGDMPLELSGDIVTEDMGRMLAQTCGGDISSLLNLAADRDVSEWARGAAIKALALLTAWGEQSRETLIAHFVRIIDDCRNRDARDVDAVPLADVVCYALALQLVELRDQLIRLFDEERVEYGMVSIGELEDELGHRAPLMLDEPIQDVAADISWWGCFHRPQSGRIATDPVKFAVDEPEPLKAIESTQPFRAAPKVGRNDPCPCGSGKKYKKCCGA